MIRATLVRKEHIAPGIATFWFQPQHPLDFLAGQYVELFLPHEHVDNRGTQRWFTISSSPQDTLVALTIRFETAGGSSYKQHLQQLAPGDTASFGEVLGDFVVPKNKQVPLIFVAGGLGITPFASMVKDLLEHTDRRTIELFYGVRNNEERIFTDVIEAYGLTPHLYLGKPLKSSDILAVASALPKPLFYLAGSQAMVLSMQRALIEAGVSPIRIALDYFPGYIET